MIFFDEAGNTGDNLLDVDQPTFTLASHDLTLEETVEVLAPLRFQVKSEELHFKSLAKRAKYQTELIQLLNNPNLGEQRVFKYTIHKEFAVIAHIVDRLIEPVLAYRGLDIYQYGMNINMANMISVLHQASWKGDFSGICKLFVAWVRSKKDEACDAFYEAVGLFAEKMSAEKIIGPEFIDFISWSYPIRNSIRDGFDDTYTLDLTLSTFRASCNYWAEKHHYPKIVMDHSKMIVHFASMINMLKSADEQIVGYGNKQYQFKLKIGDLTLGNSNEFPQIQLSDILASAFNFFAREFANGRELVGFAKEIFESHAYQSSAGDAIWPTTNVTPESIGMKGANKGINPLDHFANEVMKESDLNRLKT